jgi:hypothetical protein
MAEAETLRVNGEQCLGFHHGKYHDEVTDELKQSPGQRYFCRECGSPLWAADPRWPQWIYPFASAVRTPLPIPPESVHIMLDFKAPWVEVPTGIDHRHFERYPDESIVDWHLRHGLYIEWSAVAADGSLAKAQSTQRALSWYFFNTIEKTQRPLRLCESKKPKQS